MIYKRFTMDINNPIYWRNRILYEWHEYKRYDFSKDYLYKIDECIDLKVKLYMNDEGSFIEYCLISKSNSIKIINGNDKFKLEDKADYHLIKEFPFTLINDGVKTEYIALIKPFDDSVSDYKDYYFTIWPLFRRFNGLDSITNSILMYEDDTNKGLINSIYCYLYSKDISLYLGYSFNDNLYKSLINKRADFLGVDYKNNTSKSLEELINELFLKNETRNIENLLTIINSLELNRDELKIILNKCYEIFEIDN